MIFIKNNKILALIVLLAFILRLIGIFYGQTILIGADETPTLLASLKMIGTFSLKITASNYYYPPFIAYLYLPFLVIFLSLSWLLGIFNYHEIKEAVFFNLNGFIPLIRFVNVLFGTASIYLIYRIAEKIFNDKRIALLSAWFLAISYIHVANSHFAQTWTIQTFFILIALAWAIFLYQKQKITLKDYFLAGIFIVISFGINFVGIICYFWFILAHLFKNKGNGLTKIFFQDKNWLALNLTVLFGVILVYYLNPYGLNNYFSRITDTATPAVLGGGGHSSYKIFHLTTLQLFWYYLKNTLIQEPFIFILSIFGSVLLWFKKRIYFYFLTLWVFLYYLMISPLTGGMYRYALPIIPVLAILAAYFINYLITEKKIKWLGWFLLIIASILMLLFSVFFDLRMLKKDTRELAKDWVVKNIPSGSIIINADLNEGLCLNESRESVLFVQEYFPQDLSSKRKYLLNLNKEDYPQPNYFLLNYNYVNKISADLKIDYLIISDFDKELLDKNKLNLAENKILLKSFYPESFNGLEVNFNKQEDLDIFANVHLINNFGLFKTLKYYGPFIEIYKLN